MNATVVAGFRSVMRRVPTSVAVVAGVDIDGRPVGLAVGTFTSVSLEPPLVAFCPGSTSTSWPRIRPMRRFSISLLAESQRHLCTVFAGKADDKFDGLDWYPGTNGAPRLSGAIAYVDCDLEVEHDAGDHTVVIGRVTALEAGDGVAPLVFVEGRYLGVH
jgi:flavin reductase (DIM6/NTAB) family NADH-FMN oxidoreductase RutF